MVFSVIVKRVFFLFFLSWVHFHSNRKAKVSEKVILKRKEGWLFSSWLSFIRDCTVPPSPPTPTPQLTHKSFLVVFSSGVALPPSLTPLPLIGQQFCVLVCRTCNPHMLLCWYIFIWRTYWTSWRPPGYYILKCFEHFSYNWYKVDWLCPN